MYENLVPSLDFRLTFAGTETYNLEMAINALNFINDVGITLKKFERIECTRIFGLVSARLPILKV